MAEVIGTFSTDATLFKPSVAAALARQAHGTELTVFVPTDRACAALGIRHLDDAQALRLLRSHALKGGLFDAETLAYVEPSEKAVFAIGWRVEGTDKIRRIENGGRLAVTNLDGQRVTLSVARNRLRIAGHDAVSADTGFDASDGLLVTIDDCRVWRAPPHRMQASPKAP